MLPVQLDSQGRVKYDALVRQGQSKDKVNVQWLNLCAHLITGYICGILSPWLWRSNISRRPILAISGFVCFCFRQFSHAVFVLSITFILLAFCCVVGCAFKISGLSSRSFERWRGSRPGETQWRRHRGGINQCFDTIFSTVYSSWFCCSVCQDRKTLEKSLNVCSPVLYKTQLT